MTKAETVATVERERERESNSLFNMEFAYSTTDNFREIKEGRNTFISDIKMTDYK